MERTHEIPGELFIVSPSFIAQFVTSIGYLTANLMRNNKLFFSPLWKASNNCGCEEIHKNAFHLHCFIQMDGFQICLECCNQAETAQTNSPGHK